MENFIGSTGFSSLSTKQKQLWSSRPDWHGPGLYIGETGRLLKIPFQNRPSFALSLLTDNQKLRFLSQLPFYGQCLGADKQGFPLSIEGCNSSQYLEGASLAEAILKGLYGIEPTLQGVIFQPRFALNLIKQKPAKLTNLKIGKNTFNLIIRKSQPIPKIRYENNIINLIMANNDFLEIRDNRIVDAWQRLKKVIVSYHSKDYDLNNDGQINNLDIIFAKELLSL